ncbi:MAG TPA: hypothetical protein VF683_08550, partial [Chthoniobacterales bacterium]
MKKRADSPSPRKSPPSASRRTAQTKAEPAAAPANERARATAPLAYQKVWELIEKRRPALDFRVSFVRPDDFLVCDFVFDNLHLGSRSAAGEPR